MNKKQHSISVRQAAEKAAIRDEQNRRMEYAAAHPVKDVLAELHTTLCGLDAGAVSASRARNGSNKVTHEKKKSLAKAAGRCLCQSLYRHPVLSGSCVHDDGHGFPLLFPVRQCAGGF